MAWLKDIEQESGVVIGYWEIEKMFMQIQQRKIEISIQGWLSQEAKASGKSAAISASFLVSPEDNPELLAQVVGYIEQKAMALPEFVSATQV